MMLPGDLVITSFDVWTDIVDLDIDPEDVDIINATSRHTSAGYVSNSHVMIKKRNEFNCLGKI